MKKICSQSIYLLFITLFFSFFQTTLIEAQNPTCNSQNSPPVDYRGWAKNATVQVYIAPNITEEGEVLLLILSIIGNKIA